MCWRGSGGGSSGSPEVGIVGDESSGKVQVAVVAIVVVMMGDGDALEQELGRGRHGVTVNPTWYFLLYR